MKTELIAECRRLLRELESGVCTDEYEVALELWETSSLLISSVHTPTLF